MYLKPTIEVHHRKIANRNGKHIQLRHPSLPGYLKLDRKTKAWAYCEVRNVEGRDQMTTVVKSHNWAEHMDAFRPDYIRITPEWVTKISLRMRHAH